MVILTSYSNLYLNSGLNHGLKQPKMKQKSAKIPIFLPFDPEGLG